MAQGDWKIIVEHKTKNETKFRNEFDSMYAMMDHIYSIMHANPEAVIKVWKEWWT